jgi:hypothetical protein
VVAAAPEPAPVACVGLALFTHYVILQSKH